MTNCDLDDNLDFKYYLYTYLLYISALKLMFSSINFNLSQKNFIIYIFDMLKSSYFIKLYNNNNTQDNTQGKNN